MKQKELYEAPVMEVVQLMNRNSVLQESLLTNMNPQGEDEDLSK